MTEQISTHLAEAVEARRKELGLSPGDFVRETGLTGPALLNLRKGLVRQYQERLTTEVCRVLRWTPDSIERLLAGKEPLLLEAELPADAVDEIIGVVTSMSEPVAESLESIDQRLDRIERHLGIFVPEPRASRDNAAAGQ